MRSRALRAFEYWLRRYRRTWRASAFTSLVSPALFLAAMGLGLGSLVDQRTAGTVLAGLDYLVFLAPGLLAASSMMTAVTEATWPVMGAVRWQKTYFAMIATPLGPADVLAGHLLFVAFRLLVTCAAFLAVTAAFSSLRSPWAVLALPAAVLTGMAYAVPVAAFAVTRESDTGFATLYRFGVVPMFLFSGTFFPIEQLPALVRPLAYVTPLWHGVALCRDASLGSLGAASAALHAAYLAAWVVAGYVIAARAYAQRLAV
jgi:lipooligosaccharide transport system permease protein